MRSPVLFMVFNRTETTRPVFERIRAARPPRLYVAADGPRESKAGEAERCGEVRRIATAVDWPCELRTLLRERNLGCKRAVSSAIDWFFEHEPEGVILEDDCLPDESFFAYCDELLERYRDDPRVMCVSGVNFISRTWSPDASYYFSRYAHIWGWASWRRAWEHYDVEMSAWRAPQGSRLLDAVFPHSGAVRGHWRSIFDAVAQGRVDTWDYQWMHACWSRGGLTCLPRLNLISNIGFGADATHTVNAESKMAGLPAGRIELPLRHPASVDASQSADHWTSRHVFEIDENPPALRRVRRMVSSLLVRLRSSARV